MNLVHYILMWKMMMHHATRPQVWARPSEPCRFGVSVFDTLCSNTSTNTAESDVAGSTSSSAARPASSSITTSETSASTKESSQHYDRMKVSLETLAHNDERDGGVRLGGSLRSNDNGIQQRGSTMPLCPPSASSPAVFELPFGRARDYEIRGSTPCPTTIDFTQEATQKAKSEGTLTKDHVQLAVAGIALDEKNRVLLTRRPSYMRSFPGAWVLPGGGVDPGESLVEAVGRELFEETGLYFDADSIRPTSIWESVYPNIPTENVPIRAHHIVVYFCGRITDTETLKIQTEEVDCAVWLSPEECQRVLLASRTPNDEDLIASLCDVTLDAHDPAGTTITMDQFVGIYPQIRQPGQPGCGLAQGSLFALEEFLGRKMRSGSNS